MRGVLSSWRARSCGALIATSMLCASPAAAQIAPPVAAPPSIFDVDADSAERERRPLLNETIARVLKDPTTYALPPIVYATHRLDWDSSQKLFAYGYLERNPKFTLTGRIDDVPISHAAGKRRIVRASAATIGRSMLNNGICAIVEHKMIERAPHRRKLIRTLGWIERSLVTSYWTYRLTHNQVAQWRDNERVLAGLRAAGPPAAVTP
jgi:hypothetical protein